MENPRITPTAWSYPGACALTKSADGPFLDTGLDLFHDGRVFFTIRVIEELAAAAGLPTPAVMDEVTEERDDLAREVDELKATVEAQRELLDQYAALARAVAFTLQNGATIGRNGTLQPKIKPGDQAGPVNAALEAAALENLHGTITQGDLVTELNPSAA